MKIIRTKVFFSPLLSENLKKKTHFEFCHKMAIKLLVLSHPIIISKLYPQHMVFGFIFVLNYSFFHSCFCGFSRHHVLGGGSFTTPKFQFHCVDVHIFW